MTNKMTTYLDDDGKMQMISDEDCLKHLCILGRAFVYGLNQVGKSAPTDVSELLWSGLVAYQILNAEGESSRTDAARERVMRMITDAAFERVEEYFEQED